MSDSDLKLWTICLNNLVVSARIGILPHELTTLQPLRITLQCGYYAPVPMDSPSTDQIVCYGSLVRYIESIIKENHTYLLETLAEKIIRHCFQDDRVTSLKIHIEKLTIITNCDSVGIMVERTKECYPLK